MSASPLTIVAIITAVAGKEKALRAAQQKLVAETVREPGCLRYELNQSLDDARVLIFTERWASEHEWRASSLIEDFSLFRMATVGDGVQA
jgi:quinol monooxygenase YgiN